MRKMMMAIGMPLVIIQWACSRSFLLLVELMTLKVPLDMKTTL